MKRLALLCLLSGCLDSIVDDPCEDGFTLDDSGTCIAESHDPELTMPPLPPEQPPTSTPPNPVGTSDPNDPTMHVPDPIDPTIHVPDPIDPVEPTLHTEPFCWYACK